MVMFVLLQFICYVMVREVQGDELLAVQAPEKGFCSRLPASGRLIGEACELQNHACLDEEPVWRL